VSASGVRISGAASASRAESSGVGTRTLRCSTASGSGTAASPASGGAAGSSSLVPPNIPSTACIAHASTVCPGGSCSTVYRRQRSSIVWVSRAVKVSSTPSPFDATAGNSGTRRWLRARERAEISTTAGRSRLLYWKTRGIREASICCASRFATISWRLCSFSRQRSSAELATKATPSAPFRTTRRVAAYMACPGTASSCTFRS
jgi:hypothetical protein